MLYICSFNENMKKIFASYQNAKSLGIWYVASSSGPLPNTVKLYPWSQKWALSWSHMLNIGLYRVDMKKSCLKAHGLEP